MKDSHREENIVKGYLYGWEKVMSGVDRATLHRTYIKPAAGKRRHIGILLTLTSVFL